MVVECEVINHGDPIKLCSIQRLTVVVLPSVQLQCCVFDQQLSIPHPHYNGPRWEVPIPSLKQKTGQLHQVLEQRKICLDYAGMTHSAYTVFNLIFHTEVGTCYVSPPVPSLSDLAQCPELSVLS